MAGENEELERIIHAATNKFNQYAASQTYFIPPQAHISIDIESNELAKVYIDVEHNGNQYHFRSVEEKDIDDVHTYLNSQPAVRAKYSNGQICSLEQTTSRIRTLAGRFENRNSPLYLYSGFIVTDAETDMFIGMASLGKGTEPGTTEMARLNRTECWNHSSNNTTAGVNTIGRKIYSGVGTIEACALVQYATRLKQDGYTVDGHSLQAIVSTARTDNEASWKSACKAGMALDTVEVVERHGTSLRYLLRKNI
ncbi:unnamed protein product [Adineta ricciae]|uniref:N-acetyltransferase domain-containing protein n=1 Tax=Adineta ricciae TaxID=249248 RepID=A0A814NGN0_ADIRI|nr:unnamed protein product [Adineta ricciae]CAF1316705.1 unnamed protein product [Adineta ricciae]